MVFLNIVKRMYEGKDPAGLGIARFLYGMNVYCYSCEIMNKFKPADILF